MAHPHNEHRQHHVEHRRVEHITKGYASGGAVKEGHYDEENDKRLIERSVRKEALKEEGRKPKHRADRRARGGAVYPKVGAEAQAQVRKKLAFAKKPTMRARGGKIKRADGGQTANPKPPLNPKPPIWRTPGWDDETGTQMTPYEMKQAQKRARGGRTKHKGTTVNIINSPGHAGVGGPMPPPVGMHPPMPPPVASGPPPVMPPGAAPPMPPPGLAARPLGPMGGPGGMPGMMPPRRGGGRTYAKGGVVSGTAQPSLKVPEVKKRMSGQPKFTPPARASGGRVKDGPAWNEGLRNGTQVQHSDGKSDGKNVGRGRVVTFYAGGAVKRATGGKVESPQGVAPATKLPGGGGGGEARLAKAHRAARDYKKA